MRWLSALLVCALAGCSLIYNPNNLPRVDDAVPDADPCALALSDITPKVIYEGQGTGGSAPAVLVIRGTNIVNANLTVELKAHDGTTAVQLMPVQGARASSDHAYLAFTVTALVDDKLGNIAATDVPLDVTVRQDAPAAGGCTTAATQTLTGQLALRVLPELTNLRADVVLYSRIQVDLGPLDQTGLGGAAPLVLNAVSSIAVGEVIASATNDRAGPGGYASGGSSGPGGGGDGQPAAVLGVGGGGGGAGYATAGVTGDSGVAVGGRPGPAIGEDQILSLTTNRASAGGRGGAGLAIGLVPGGIGGGGGGTIVITAGGDITTGDLIAAGGNGAAGNGGGGGGGGAGGTVIVRSQSGKVKAGIVHVPPGIPGAGGGGMASAGRVRWDSPVGEAPSSPDRTAHRGPSFLAPARVVTARGQAFTLIGSPGDELNIRVSDGRDVSEDARNTSFSAAGKATITPQLLPGYNQLCAKLAGGATSEPVANVCTEVAFVP